MGILTSWFPLAACRRPGEQITVCNGRVRAKRIRGISVSHQSPTVIGGLRGAEPPMRARKPNSEKLMLSRLETRLCKVCRVDSIFSHTLINRIFRKKCVKRVYVPCTPCTRPTGACQQMRNKMLSTLHTLHNGGAAAAARSRVTPSVWHPHLCNMLILMRYISPIRDFEVKYVHL